MLQPSSDVRSLPELVGVLESAKFFRPLSLPLYAKGNRAKVTKMVHRRDIGTLSKVSILCKTVKVPT